MGIKIIAKNKKAYFNYQILGEFEAGIMLKGSEIKSIRDQGVNIGESWVNIKNQEAWIHNMNIPHYKYGNINNHDELRIRKLLLNKKEIIKIEHEIKTQRLTVIPTKIYFKKSLVKIQIGLGKGKKLHDKKRDKQEKDVKRKLREQKFD